MSLYDLFHETAERQPDRPAILGPAADGGWTYRRLRDAVRDAGDALARAGVGPGACVALHVPSGRDYVVLTYAVWRCGGVVVPVAVELPDAEKREIRRGIAVDFVISDRASLGFAEPFHGGGEAEAVPAAPGFVVAAVRPAREHPVAFREVDAAFVRFTSGTTGTSKGVVLSHRTVSERIEAANEVLRIGPADRVVWLLSMSYHFAVSIVCYLTYGAGIVLPRNGLGPVVLDAIRRHGGTLIYASPAHYAWLAEAPGVAGPLPALRLAISTTASLDPETARAFRGRFGIPISQALGLIEVGLPCINVDFAADRPGAVGRVLPAYRVRLSEAGIGPSAGEIAFAGKGFLDAYYEPWRTRDEIMPDGWFRTGDVGEIDADGCLVLRGRSNDAINVMGMKFFPAEVEATLESHPRVREACVVPVPHPRLGEVPAARVVADGAADVADGSLERELLDHCRKRLAAHKVPTAIEFVAELPRTASGKLLRRAAAPSAAPLDPVDGAER